jgi:hypothetical protein
LDYSPSQIHQVFLVQIVESDVLGNFLFPEKFHLKIKVVNDSSLRHLEFVLGNIGSKRVLELVQASRDENGAPKLTYSKLARRVKMYIVGGMACAVVSGAVFPGKDGKTSDAIEFIRSAVQEGAAVQEDIKRVHSSVGTRALEKKSVS